MSYYNLDSKERIDYFLAELSKLSCETGIQVGDDSPTNPYIVHDDKLKGRYALENSVCYGFKHDKYLKGA